VSEGAEAIPLVQPLADIHLDQESGLLLNDVDEDGAASDEEMQDAEEDEEMDDDDIHPAVVAPQHLADVFDAAPAFAMPPIEDLFYQVAKLYAAPPLKTSASP
jgi:NET1-associated nuclear protein 1 (U3 small nucleolar RNA-associated protein 17)